MRAGSSTVEQYPLKVLVESSNLSRLTFAFLFIFFYNPLSFISVVSLVKESTMATRDEWQQGYVGPFLVATNNEPFATELMLRMTPRRSAVDRGY
jgi:hypothetical protein